MSDVAPPTIDVAQFFLEIKKLLQEQHEELRKSWEACLLQQELPVAKVHSSPGAPVLDHFLPGPQSVANAVVFPHSLEHLDETTTQCSASKTLTAKGFSPLVSNANKFKKAKSFYSASSSQHDIPSRTALPHVSYAEQCTVFAQTPTVHRFQGFRKRHKSVRLGRPSKGERSYSLSHNSTADTKVSKKGFRHLLWASFQMEELKLEQGRKEAAKAVGMNSNWDESFSLSKSTLTKIVDSNRFEVFFTIVIASNAVFMGVQVDHAAKSQTDSVPTHFFAISIAYATIFIIELILRMSASGLNFFRPSRMFLWNCVDMLCVVVTMFELVMDAIMKATQTSLSTTGKGNVRMMRLFRLARFLRIVRMTRLLRFIHALRTFIYSIIATLRTLFWALTLLALILYVFGILFTQVVNDHNIEHEPRKSVEAETSSNEAEMLRKFWGSLPKAMFTLFKSVSGGLSWHECVSPLEIVGGFWVAFFIIFVAFTYFAVLNVVTGIFCENAIHTARNDEELLVQDRMDNRELFVRRIRHLFNELNEDEENPHLTIAELERRIEDPEVQAVFDSLHVDASDAWALFKLLDVNEDNVIEIDEFVVGLMKLKGEAKRGDILELDAKLGAVLRGLGHINGVLASMMAHAASMERNLTANNFETMLQITQRIPPAEAPASFRPPKRIATMSSPIHEENPVDSAVILVL